MTGLSISMHINALLKDDTALTELIGDRMYPIVTVHETTFPFVVYERTAVGSEYTKDGRTEDSVSCAVYILAETYEESVRIAELARKALEGKAADYDGFSVTDAEFSGATEAYDSDTFIQRLDFQFTVE